ncbi:hypothetical protein D3C85_985860 [compost metagenome]
MIKSRSLAMFGASTTAMHCWFAAISMLPSAQQKISDTGLIRYFRTFFLAIGES